MSKRSVSYENHSCVRSEVKLHVSQTRFETEAQGNTEIAYCLEVLDYIVMLMRKVNHEKGCWHLS